MIWVCDMSTKQKMSLPSLALVLISVAWFVFSTYENNFPLGYHFDEPKKVLFVLRNTQDFYHPMLLLQVCKVVTLMFGASDPNTIAWVGRLISAVSGGFAIVSAYTIVARNGSSLAALFTAACLSSMPIMVVHGHYMKEDMLLLAGLSSLLALVPIFINGPPIAAGLIFGLAAGVCFSSHYKSFLILISFGVFIFVQYGPRQGTRWFSKNRSRLLISGSTSLLFFLLVNYPAVLNFRQLLAGFTYEVEHSLTGHAGISISPLSHWFSYHLTRNLFPGMTPVLASVSILVLVESVIFWRRTSEALRLMTIFTLVFYIVPEISPSKPPPDSSRYMIPVAYGGVVCLGLRLSKILAPRPVQYTLWTVASVALLMSLVESLYLLVNLSPDTREIACKWLDNQPAGKVVVYNMSGFDRYTHVYSGAFRIDDFADFDTIVIDDFQYGRFFEVSDDASQGLEVIEQLSQYRVLFNFPFVEFKPIYKTYGFSNPTVRVVDLRPFRDGDDKIKSVVNE